MTIRAVAYQNRLIKQGKCPHCRETVGEINPRTGKPYQYCIQERARRAEAVALKRYYTAMFLVDDEDEDEE